MAPKAKALPSKKMVADLQAAATLLGTSIVANMTKGKTYEAWIMFEIALDLTSTPTHDPAPVTVKPCNFDRSTASTTFVVRGGPGHIQAISPPPTQGMCHFEFSRNGRSLELHASVEHFGHSGTDHELDLSVMPTHTVDIYRLAGGAYDGERALGLELKAYAASATLDKNVARALVAVAADLDPTIALPRFVRGSHSGATYPSLRFPHPLYALITSAQISAESQKYMTWYDVRYAANVDVTTPGAPQAAVDVANVIRRHL